MSSKMIADQESTIKDSLFDFVRFHISDADLNLIDEIVLSYVIAFLEDVGDDSHFDVEGTTFTKKCVTNTQIVSKRVLRNDGSLLSQVCYNQSQHRMWMDVWFGREAAKNRGGSGQKPQFGYQFARSGV